MKILVSFGSKGYENGLERLSKSAEPYFDKICLYNEESIAPFIAGNQHLFAPGNKGFGWWAWKPYIIMATLDRYPDSTIMYTDALCEFINDPEPLFTYSPITLFDQSVAGHKEIHYTKEDVLAYYSVMGSIDPEAFHLTATFQIYNDSQQALRFLQDYYHGCTNLHLVNEHITLPCDPLFKTHRHDQSILGMLSQVYKPFVQIKQDPSQWGIINDQQMETRGYKQIINHHRNI